MFHQEFKVEARLYSPFPCRKVRPVVAGRWVIGGYHPWVPLIWTENPSKLGPSFCACLHDLFSSYKWLALPVLNIWHYLPA